MPAEDTDTRRRLLKSISESYFSGIAKRDVSTVPWHDDIELRSPLAPEGLEVPLRGRRSVVAWFESLYPVFGEVRVIEHYLNDSLTAIATRADVGITQPACCLRVVDRFTIDPDGRIVEQENHYDPRAAVPPSADIRR